MIWRTALPEGQVIAIKAVDHPTKENERYFQITYCYPKLLQVCCEARQEALPFYKPGSFRSCLDRFLLKPMSIAAVSADHGVADAIRAYHGDLAVCSPIAQFIATMVFTMPKETQAEMYILAAILPLLATVFVGLRFHARRLQVAGLLVALPSRHDPGLGQKVAGAMGQKRASEDGRDKGSDCCQSLLQGSGITTRQSRVPRICPSILYTCPRRTTWG
jgi:hypothetical protein